MSTETVSFVISIVSVSIAVAAFVIARRDPRPRVRGQINTVLHAPLELPDGSLITAIMVHVSLTNSRKNPTHIVSYDLDIDRGAGAETVARLKNLSGFPSFTAGDRRIELNEETLIYKPIRPIEYGDAQVGLIVFYVTDANVTEDDVRSYDLTVTDIFGRRYAIEDARRSAPAGGFDTVELFELAGATVTKASSTPVVELEGQDPQRGASS